MAMQTVQSASPSESSDGEAGQFTDLAVLFDMICCNGKPDCNCNRKRCNAENMVSLKLLCEENFLIQVI